MTCGSGERGETFWRRHQAEMFPVGGIGAAGVCRTRRLDIGAAPIGEILQVCRQREGALAGMLLGS
jgi:hypothetical protein